GTDRAVERTEVAARHAHVGVVDVAIDDVGDVPLGVLARPDTVGERPEQMRRRMTIKRERFGGINPAALLHLVCDLFDHRRSARPAMSVARNLVRSAASLTRLALHLKKLQL